MPIPVLYKVEGISNDMYSFCANHRGHGKKSLTAVISKCIFSGFEKSHRLYYKFDCILLCINKK